MHDYGRIQLETGLSQSYFSFSVQDYGPIATRSWIAATWEFLSDSNMITIANPFPKPELACTSDRFHITECFFEHGYQSSELHQLNNCCLHLHALYLSDLCTADERHLTNEALEVQPDTHSVNAPPSVQNPSFLANSIPYSILPLY
jgi:hypothetical protein